MNINMSLSSIFAKSTKRVKLRMSSHATINARHTTTPNIFRKLNYSVNCARFQSTSATVAATSTSLDENINNGGGINIKHSSEIRGLSNEEKRFLEENGYLLIKNFVLKDVALNLRSRMMNLLREFDERSTKSVFRTHRTDVEYKDTYFLNSSNKISYFWEENVFDEKTGLLNREKEYAINKVGHALHTLDPYFNSFVYGFLPQLVFDIGMIDPIALQSMYICKQPGVGGEVDKHQDTAFLKTDPHSCHGLWLAIDSTNEKNGCIWVAPGSHKTAGLRNRFQRVSDGETRLIPLSVDDDNDDNDSNEYPAGSYEDYHKDGVAVPCDSGDLLILHGEVVHWSDANKSNIARHALMMHCVDNKCQYASDNWLQYPNGPQSFPKFTQKDIENQINKRQLIENAQF